MHVSIDEKCQGHGRCLALAPEVFYVNNDGYGAVVGDGQFDDDRKNEVRNASVNCPEAAIRVRR